MIYAFGKTVEALTPTIDERYDYVKGLNEYARKLISGIDTAVINSPENTSPYILNISLVGLKSETVLHFLEQSEIYVSSGSACSRGKKSSVLSAFGLNDKRVDSAIRISFSKDSTMNEIDRLCEELDKAVKTLARAR